MNTTKGICYICGRHTYTQEHHCIHGYANRKIAEHEGLKVYLCAECHTQGKRAVHRCHEVDLELQRDAQRTWEQKYMEDYPYEHHAEEAAREAWISLFGKSWL